MSVPKPVDDYWGLVAAHFTNWVDGSNVVMVVMMMTTIRSPPLSHFDEFSIVG
jgi:hypothetical protein